MSKLDEYKDKVEKQGRFEEKLEIALEENRPVGWFISWHGDGLNAGAPHTGMFWRLLAKYIRQNRDGIVEYMRSEAQAELALALKEAQDEAIETLRNLGRGER